MLFVVPGNVELDLGVDLEFQNLGDDKEWVTLW